MKHVEKAIYELLKGLAGGRVYALRAAQNAPAPFVVYQRIDGERWRSLDGPSGVAQAMVQVDAYAGEYYEAKELAHAAEAILDGYRGEAAYGAGPTADTVMIESITLQDESDLLDQTAEPVLARVRTSYFVIYQQ